MQKILPLLACAALFAAPLAFTTPAFAEPADENSSEEWSAPQFQGQWEQFRAEHEALLAERDRLVVRCMDAKGQDKSACEEQWKDLRARHDEWRQRVAAFRDQSMSSKDGHKGWHRHGMHTDMHKHHHDMKKDGAKQPAAAPQNKTAPAGQ